MPTTSKQLTQLSDEELAKLVTGNDQPLTLRQRAEAHLDAREESRCTVRKYMRASLVGFVVLLVGIGGTRYLDVQELSEHRRAVRDSANSVAVQSCNRSFRVALAQRLALSRSRPDRDDRSVSAEARAHRIRALTPLPDCRRAATAVTDDPRKIKRPPEPLHEGRLRGDQLGVEGG